MSVQEKATNFSGSSTLCWGSNVLLPDSYFLERAKQYQQANIIYVVRLSFANDGLAFSNQTDL